jgi:protein-disulfide isomerase
MPIGFFVGKCFNYGKITLNILNTYPLPFMMISKKQTTILVISLCVGGILLGKFLLRQVQSLSYNSVQARSKGNPNADVKIQEYIDFQCPACAQGSIALSKMFSAHPDDLFIEIKYFPLRNHPHGMLAARYAECAARQGKFWAFQGLLVEKQSYWSELNNAEPMLRRFVQEAGVDEAQLRSCLDDKRTDEVIKADRATGKSLGVQSTPTYFVNGKMMVGLKSLDEELKNYLGENLY